MQDRNYRIVEIFLPRTAGPYIWVNSTVQNVRQATDEQTTSEPEPDVAGHIHRTRDVPHIRNLEVAVTMARRAHHIRKAGYLEKMQCVLS
jgi:hypothetical protein